MFRYWRDTVRKHKNKILISAGVVAGTYLLGKYVASKVEQFQQKLKEENFAKEQVKRRFKQTQSDCYMTFLSLLPVLVEPIYEDLNVEEITRELQSRRSDKLRRRTAEESQARSEAGLSTVASEDFVSTSEHKDGVSALARTKTKTELWSSLKIESITRFLTLLYGEALLIIFLHLQLNILSRKSYFETAVRLATSKGSSTPVDSPSSSDTEESTLPEQAFLSFSWWLLNKGWVHFKDVIQQSVEEVFGEINPRQELTIEEFAALLNTIQRKVHVSGDSSLIVQAVLPPAEMEFFLLQQTNDIDFLSQFNANLGNSETLSKLLDEVRTYLENEQVPSILDLLVTVGISKVLDSIFLDIVSKKMGPAVLPEEMARQKQEKLKLASLLASVTKQSNKLANNSFDNDILYTLNNLQELDDLSAGVYSNFDN